MSYDIICSGDDMNILFVTTGGTIMSESTANGLAPMNKAGGLFSLVPEIDNLCKTSEISVCSIDSTNMTPEIWLKIAETIKANYSAFDGFIVCHGTDTLAYTAAALSYMLQGSQKPIAITGSQKPITAPDTDARRNLLDSIAFVCDKNAHGVAVVFNGKVIDGKCAKKLRTKSNDAFESINRPLIGKIKDGKVTFIAGCKACEKSPFYIKLNPSVFLLKLVPGLFSGVIPYILERYSCLILEGFGTSGIPKDIAEAINNYPKISGKIIVFTSQAYYEGTDVSLYAVGHQLSKDIIFLEAREMTSESVYVKMMWLLAKEKTTTEEITALFYKEQ